MDSWFSQTLLVGALAAFLAGCASPQMTVASIPETGGTPLGQGFFSNAPRPSSPIPASFSTAPAPAGFVSFCLRFQDQCESPTSISDTLTLTPASWNVLSEVNDHVNSTIQPEDDIDHYGRAEYWTIATDGYGDCDDYAVTKRKLLIETGIPELALRIGVVLTPEGARHAVLTVTTDRGDYVLDNLHPDIRPWTETDYTWIERQASTSAWEWVALNGNSLSTTAATASLPNP